MGSIIEMLGREKFIIYGAGTIARAVIKTLRAQYEDIDKRLVGCAVTDLNFNVQMIEGLQVYSIKEVKSFYTDELILICVREKDVEDVKSILNSYGIKKYYTFDLKNCIEILEKNFEKKDEKRYILFQNNIDRDSLSNEEYVMFLSKQLKDRTIDFEVNLADHCNLNCQCCNHFSPVAEEKYLDIETFTKDMRRLSEILEGRVGTIMLLGGEPLLYKDINKAMKISRQFFPNASIVIVSNGLLLPKMGQDFWRICRENRIGIHLTKYPIKFDYDECERIAEKNGVKLDYTLDSVNKTTYRLPIREEGQLNACKNYVKCYHAAKCVVLREGRLYTCPISAYVHHLNKYFNKHLPEGECNSVDIYSINSFEELDIFLKSPIPMCSYCDIYNYEYGIPWNTSRRELAEWM